MRIVHVAPRAAAKSSEPEPATLALAQAEASASGDQVQVVAASSIRRTFRHGQMETLLMGTCRPRWLGRSPELLRHLLACPLELIHAHCLGGRSLHYAKLAAEAHGAPLVISPRGRLGFGEQGGGSPRTFIDRFIIHPQALEQAAGWRATSIEEAAAIRSCGFHQPICVAPEGVNLPDLPQVDQARASWLRAHPILAGRPVALCIGPVRPFARMQAIVTIWCSVAPKDWILLLQGFSQAEYRQLSALASSRGTANRVLLAPECEAPPHAVARLLLAPGTTPSIAPIAQALAWGVPALVADNSPWSRLEPKQAGWCVRWNEYTVALDRVLRLEDGVLSEYGRCARQLAQQEFAWPVIAGRLLTFYRNLRS